MSIQPLQSALERSPESAGEARVCMVSMRRMSSMPSRCAGFEFEDVIREVDRVDVVAPRWVERPSGPIAATWAGRLRRYAGLTVSVPPRVERVQPGRSYDLLFAVLANPSDLYELKDLRAWRKRCGVAVAWVEELWQSELGERSRLEMLKVFDYIFVTCAGTVRGLRR